MFLYLHLPVHVQGYTRISRSPSTKGNAEYFLWQSASPPKLNFLNITDVLIKNIYLLHTAIST